MKFIPYHRFEIVSSLKPAAALAALAAITEPEKAFRWRWPNEANDRRFQGRVEGDRFQVRRIIGYRNSFLPVIEGAVASEARGSRIAVTMRLFPFVIVFIAIWAALVSALLFTGMWHVGLAMLALLYLLAMAAFWLEAGKQERTLRELFRARD